MRRTSRPATAATVSGALVDWLACRLASGVRGAALRCVVLRLLLLLRRLLDGRSVLPEQHGGPVREAARDGPVQRALWTGVERRLDRVHVPLPLEHQRAIRECRVCVAGWLTCWHTLLRSLARCEHVCADDRLLRPVVGRQMHGQPMQDRVHSRQRCGREHEREFLQEPAVCGERLHERVYGVVHGAHLGADNGPAVVVDDCAFVVEQHTGGDVSEHACRERRRRWRRHGRCVRGASAVAVVLNALAGSGGPGQSTSTACTTTTTTCAAGGSSNYNSWNTTSLVFDSNGRTVSLS